MDDFESLPEFQALIVAAAGKPERNMGDSVIPQEPPQWGDVRRMARELAKSAPEQLALHIYLIQSETCVEGFVGLQRSLQTLEELMSSNWDSMYPAPDLDDPDDMYYERVNLLHQLNEQTDVLSTQLDFPNAVHRLPLVDVRGIGAFSSRDIDISAGIVQGSEEDHARCQDGLIRGAFAQTDAEQLQILSTALDSAYASCLSIESLFTEKSGQADELSLQRLAERVDTCRQRFHEYADEHLATLAPIDDEGAQSADEVESSEAQQGQSAPAKPSSLGNRGMVREAFEAILFYYQENEPSSPVRIFAHRASDFVDKSFFDILQELAPAHRDNLPALLEQLEKQPLAFLFSDSYYRFLSGETLPAIAPGSAPAAMPDTSQPNVGSEAEHEPVIENQDAETLSAPAPEQQPGNTHPGHVISSREQVLVLLQDIETYFVNNEPASPIPLMVGEIRKLVPKRFMELVAEFNRTVPKPSAEPSE